MKPLRLLTALLLAPLAALHAAEPKGGKWNPDSISMTGGPTVVWIDHCSVTWGGDENLSPTSYQPPDGIPGHRLFVRDCIIAEGLNRSTHEEGSHPLVKRTFLGSRGSRPPVSETETLNHQQRQVR